jgi:hypothetical protein
MEAAQRVRYPIEQWPNEFAREDSPYQWNWDKYDRIPGLSIAQVHWILDSDPNNGGDSKQKNDPLILNEAEMIYETGIFTQNNRPYHIDTSSPTWNHLRYEQHELKNEIKIQKVQHQADGILWAHQVEILHDESSVISGGDWNINWTIHHGAEGVYTDQQDILDFRKAQIIRVAQNNIRRIRYMLVNNAIKLDTFIGSIIQPETKHLPSSHCGNSDSEFQEGVNF